MTRKILVAFAILTIATTGSPKDGAEPKIFGPGVISTGDHEFSIAFSPDQHQVYWTLANPGQPFVFAAILTSTLQNGRWSEPQVVSFSGQYRDLDPAVSPDGQHLCFMSFRKTNQDDSDIYMVDKTAHGWSEPRALGPEANTTAREVYPSVAANGNLYFGSNRDGGFGQMDLYVARWNGGGFAPAENLGPVINSTASESNAFIAPDESYLIFASDRPGGFGESDLYISFPVNGSWTPPRNLGPSINTKAVEFCPSVSPDGKRLFFSRMRGLQEPLSTHPLTYREIRDRLRNAGNGLGDIYSVDAAPFIGR